MGMPINRAGYEPIVTPAQMVIVMIKKSDLHIAREALKNQFPP